MRAPADFGSFQVFALSDEASLRSNEADQPCTIFTRRHEGG
jgi:hypothetical protein